MNKKGELTSGEIIGIVIVIAGAILLLFFLPSFIELFSGEENEELCRLSVIARATTPSSGQGLIPLRCSTEKICISEEGDKDDCRQFAGEDVTNGVGLEKKNDMERRRIIEKQIADSMFNCWEMMGEGKLDLFGTVTDISTLTDSFLGDYKEPVCVICSRIAIENELMSNADFREKVLDEVDLAEFIRREKPEGLEKSYADYFVGTGVSYPVSKGDEETPEATDQLAVIFTQIVTESNSLDAAVSASSEGLILWGGTYLIRPRLPTFPEIAAVGVGIGGGAAVSAWKAYVNQETAAIHCEEFYRDSSRARKGCSSVRVVEWTSDNVRNINRLCAGGIEGNL